MESQWWIVEMSYDPRSRRASFESRYDYESHLKQLLASEEWRLEEGEKRDSFGSTERQFTHSISGEKWRLIEPDPPFRGNWEKID